MARERLPDFFIVGAPKCGTTSLVSWLRQHPRIFMPNREINFLSRDLEIWRAMETWEEYRRIFAPAPATALVGEKSVSYLYSEAATEAIRSMGSHVRVVILLRNPVDMVWSLHAYLLRVGSETEPNFERAWELEGRRRKGEAIPRNSLHPCFLMYRAMGSYFLHVERYLESFGDRAKVIVFDDLAADPGGVFRDLLMFLGIDDGFEPRSYKVENKYASIKSYPLLKLWFTVVASPPARLRKIARKIGPIPITRLIASGLYRLAVDQTASKPKMPSHVRARLKETFHEDVRRLDGLLGTDLMRRWGFSGFVDR